MRTLAKSTPRQRANLIQLHADLSEAFDSIPARFWATRDQRTAYATVLAHLENWIGWESNE